MKKRPILETREKCLHKQLPHDCLDCLRYQNAGLEGKVSRLRTELDRVLRVASKRGTGQLARVAEIARAALAQE